MKKHVHYTLTLIVGIALGAVLCGGAYAAGVMAQPTWQPIYIDGDRKGSRIQRLLARRC